MKFCRIAHDSHPFLKTAECLPEQPPFSARFLFASRFLLCRQRKPLLYDSALRSALRLSVWLLGFNDKMLGVDNALTLAFRAKQRK